MAPKSSARKPEIKIPAVRMKPAGEEWLAALGLLEGPKEDEEAKVEENGETEEIAEWEQGISAFET